MGKLPVVQLNSKRPGWRSVATQYCVTDVLSLIKNHNGCEVRDKGFVVVQCLL